MGSMGFRNPQALSSALTVLGMLQPMAFRSLNPIDPMVSVSNLYKVYGEMIRTFSELFVLELTPSKIRGQ